MLGACGVTQGRGDTRLIDGSVDDDLGECFSTLLCDGPDFVEDVKCSAQGAALKMKIVASRIPFGESEARAVLSCQKPPVERPADYDAKVVHAAVWNSLCPA